MTESTGGLAAQNPSASALLTELVRALPGVAMLVPTRSDVRDVLAHAATALAPSSLPLSSGSLGTASGGTFAEPVLVRVSGEEVAVSVDVCVAEGSSAPDVARAVGGAVREWCRRSHPDRPARVSVRIAGVD